MTHYQLRLVTTIASLLFMLKKSFRNLYLYKINSILYYVIKDDHFM